MKRWLIVVLLLTGCGRRVETPPPAAPLRLAAPVSRTTPLDPRGRIHIAIGVPDSVDTLKTFVEPEGNFSPGFGSYGIYFWVYDRDAKRLFAPTMDGVALKYGLRDGLLIPWSEWSAGDVVVQTEVAAAEIRGSFVDGARATLSNKAKSTRNVSLLVALRPVGAAGWPVRRLSISGRMLLINGYRAIFPEKEPTVAGVSERDDIGAIVTSGAMPQAQRAVSPAGNASGALRFDVTLEPGKSAGFAFAFPVLPGRRAIGHRWDKKGPEVQLDLNDPNPDSGGVLQTDPPPPEAGRVFDAARAYWLAFGAASITVPDPRWTEAFSAIPAHLAMTMNEGTPDVAVINYNTFTRDGVFTAAVFDRAGLHDLARVSIKRFLAQPFSGRVYPEADNPGEVLWIAGEHWRWSRDEAWLRTAMPVITSLARTIEYYRTTPPPHWVANRGAGFGSEMAEEERTILEPGRCDGIHPEYTEAFDVAGLRAASELSAAAGDAAGSAKWRALAATLFSQYDARFGADLGRDYGSYVVLWPARLYPPGEGKAHERFRDAGPQPPVGWRYFPLATAHQSLLAGNRAAGHGTIEQHLDHEQMRGWYAFDEGGESAPGNWTKVRTTWNPAVAMPHGWAIAELWLLMRDALIHEDGDQLVLFAGIPEEWLRKPLELRALPTAFGAASVTWKPDRDGGILTVEGANPPAGFLVRLKDRDVRVAARTNVRLSLRDR